jgi:hypothetical protein
MDSKTKRIILEMHAETKQRQTSFENPYRNRHYKVNTPIRVSSANIPNGSSNTDTNISLRYEFGKPFWK